MDKLTQIFLSEATELCEQLEKALLELEKDASNKDSIGSVFRTMHTLKGAAGMFGFDHIDSITHHLESIFEEIRDGARVLTSDILNVTFKTLDHLHTLMNDPKLENKDSLQTHESLLGTIKQLSQKGTHKSTQQDRTHVVVSQEKAYYICFTPAENILRNGINPLFLIEDLLSLGTGISLPYLTKTPLFDEFEPNKSIIGFEIILSTAKQEEDIKDVFMFVLDDCELTISKLSNDSIDLEHPSIQQLLSSQNTLTFKGFEEINKLFATQQTTKLNTKIQEQAKSANTIRVSSESLDELMNLMSELVTTQAQLALLSEFSENPKLIQVSENVEKITRRLRDNVFSISLMPLENLIVKFQRLVRDLSMELNKDVIFTAEGTETEIDKSIFEKLSDPLLHILRNSLDHGIEAPEIRLKNGKSAQGTILFKSYYSGANVIIEISDDGAGINLEKVKQKAISKGLITPEANLDESELVNLIFLPGFSTAEKVTGVSGRGVGMDVVKNNINDIKGDIHIATRKGLGTIFTISLPLTLSIIDGLLVKIGETSFILPLSVVQKCYEVPISALKTTINQWITLEEVKTPFLYLKKHFNIETPDSRSNQIIKIGYENQSVGLVVDSITGQYQAVLKPLGQYYKNQEEFSGATILGDGSVALILDTNKLIKKLLKQEEFCNQ